MEIEPVCLAVRQNFNPHQYYLSRMNLAGRMAWFVTLKPMDIEYWTSPDAAISQGFETVEGALGALSTHLNPDGCKCVDCGGDAATHALDCKWALWCTDEHDGNGA